MIAPLLLVAPVMMIRGVTAVWPLIDAGRISFTDNRAGVDNGFVGFDNYSEALNDVAVQQTIEFTLVYVLSTTFMSVAFGLGLAVLLNTRFRGRRFIRSINLLPWAIPVVVAGVAFHYLLDPNFGVIARILEPVFGEVLWLSRPGTARLSLIGVTVWKTTPFVTVIFLAGMQAIPDELHEAAMVDGARPRQYFYRITLPMIAPLVISLTTFLAIGQVANFDLMLTLTGGGPGNATETVAYRAYLEGFRNLNFGGSAALGMVLLAVVAVIGAVGVTLQRLAERRA